MNRKIGVVGAGLMGAEIALVFALAGNDVLLNDRDEASLEKAMGRLRLILEKGVTRGFYPESDIDLALRNIRPVSDLGTFADRDLVTEAVFEAPDVKAVVLKALDVVCKSDCIIATNTSTIPISTLAGELPPLRRTRFIGTHYFSPVSRMKLVEVIPGFDTGDEAVAAVMALMSEIGKTPITVKDVAGFAVNRMLHAFIIEAVRLVEEGVATPEDLDTACRLGLGHPIGPFALMDAVTSTLCVQAQEIMQESYGERFRPPPLLKQRVRGGFGGGKGKAGWLTRGQQE
jgi:3-hydroxybutyryl-CoA dehydrogenase